METICHVQEFYFQQITTFVGPQQSMCVYIPLSRNVSSVNGIHEPCLAKLLIATAKFFISPSGISYSITIYLMFAYLLVYAITFVHPTMFIQAIQLPPTQFVSYKLQIVVVHNHLFCPAFRKPLSF